MITFLLVSLTAYLFIGLCCAYCTGNFFSEYYVFVKGEFPEDMTDEDLLRLLDFFCIKVMFMWPKYVGYFFER
jgi:hypothetical protein